MMLRKMLSLCILSFKDVVRWISTTKFYWKQGVRPLRWSSASQMGSSVTPLLSQFESSEWWSHGRVGPVFLTQCGPQGAEPPLQTPFWPITGPTSSTWQSPLLPQSPARFPPPGILRRLQEQGGPLLSLRPHTAQCLPITVLSHGTLVTCVCTSLWFLIAGGVGKSALKAYYSFFILSSCTGR